MRDHGAVVPVGWSACSEARQRGCVGHQAARHREGVVQLQALERCGAAGGLQARGQPVVQQGPVVGARHQADHRRVQAVGGQQRSALRPDLQEGAHDAAHRVQVHLVQRQPLAEHAVVGEPPAHRSEVLHRVQRGRSAARRVEEIRDHHVVALGAGAHEAARIGDQHARLAGTAGLPEAGNEERGCVRHLGQEFDRVHLQAGLGRRSRRGHPGAEAQEQRSARTGMQQQRDPCLARVGHARHVAAFLRPVVDVQAAHALRILDHADRGHGPNRVRDHAAAFGQLQEVQPRGGQHRRRAGGQRRPRQQPAPGAARQQRDVAQRDCREHRFRAQPGQQRHAEDGGGQGCPQRVRGDGGAEGPARIARLHAEVAEQRAHRHRRQHEGQRGRQGLGADRRGDAGSDRLLHRGSGLLAEAQPVEARHAAQRQGCEQPGPQAGAIRGAGEVALVERCPGGGACQVDRQHQRVGVDGVLGDPRQHADHDHFVADAQQAGERKQPQQGGAALRGCPGSSGSPGPAVLCAEEGPGDRCAGEVQPRRHSGGRGVAERRGEDEGG